MSVIRSYPDRYISKVATILMNDEIISKFLYYNDVDDKDIYALPKVKNPVGKLKDVKVFCNRRVEAMFVKSDISLFINLKNDNPYSKNGRKSLFFETMELEVGVICHNDCRKTLNGIRESIIFDRVQYIMKNTEELEAVGKPHLSATTMSYNIPYDYSCYVLTATINYFSTM